MGDAGYDPVNRIVLADQSWFYDLFTDPDPAEILICSSKKIIYPISIPMKGSPAPIPALLYIFNENIPDARQFPFLSIPFPLLMPDFL